MVVIGITGQTGAGKTTALHALIALGGHTIDCDAVYHQLLAHSAPLQQDLTHRFGDILNPQGGIDRKKLGNLVFSDQAALADLNQITHRHIIPAIAQEIAQAEGEGCVAVGIDAIRLVESGLSTLCYKILAVTASTEIRIQRIMTRENISRDYAAARVNAQAGEDFYKRHADFILNSNHTSPAQLQQQAEELFTQILSEQEGLST